MNENKEKKIVIVGGGIAGGAATLVAYHAGHQVVLITKKAYYTRSQVVFIDKKQIKFLKKFQNVNDPKDIELFKRLDSVGTVPINKIEKFYHRKIATIINDEKNKNRLSVYDESKGELEKIVSPQSETDKTQVLIADRSSQDKKSTLINADLVIDASGSARVAYSAIEGEKQAQAITQPIGFSPKHLPQGTSLFKLAEPALFKHAWDRFIDLFYRKKVFVPTFSADQQEKLKTMGWDKSYLPKVYIIPNPNRTKFYVGGDIPQKILDIKNTEQKQSEIKKWHRYMLECQFELKLAPVSLKQAEKKKNTYLAFSMLTLAEFKDLQDFLIQDQYKTQSFFKKISSIVGEDQQAGNLYKRLSLTKEELVTITNILQQQASTTSSADAEKAKNILLKLNKDEKKLFLINHYIEYYKALGHEKQKAQDLAEKAVEESMQSKQNLRHTAFALNLSRIQSDIINKYPTIIPVGDAYQSPHFHFGHGAIDALKSVEKIQKKAFSPVPNLHEKLTKQHNDRLKPGAIAFLKELISQEFIYLNNIANNDLNINTEINLKKQALNILKTRLSAFKKDHRQTQTLDQLIQAWLEQYLDGENKKIGELYRFPDKTVSRDFEQLINNVRERQQPNVPPVHNFSLQP